MAEITFYTNPMSRGRIVRWMLEEVGRPYRTEVVAFGPAMKAASYLAINPMGKVPALVHGETVVTEAGAICAYLADAFPEAELAPAPQDPLRGAYYRWLFFAAGPIEAAATNKALGVVVPAERKGLVGYGSLEAVTDTLEAAVRGRDVLVGDRFTAADLYLGAQVGWLMDFGVIERRPEIDRYVAGLRRRPAAIRASKMDDELAERAAGGAH
jgi:glutathione S-transferase